MLGLTRNQATELVDAQMSLDRAESWAHASTITLVPAEVRSEDLASWREAERLRIVGDDLGKRDALLSAFDIDPASWTELWRGFMKRS